MALSEPSGSWSGSYSYDGMFRLHHLTSPAGTFSYGHFNGTGREISSVLMPGGSISYGYDPAGLLTNTALGKVDSYAYAYNSVGWRPGVTRTDGSQMGYGYDNIGQLTSATGTESSGTSRFNENFGYAYDPAGNLTNRMNDTLQQAFAVDGANRLTNVLRTTGAMTVAGAFTNGATALAIDGQSAAIYHDGTFAAQNVPLVDGNNIFTNALTLGGATNGLKVEIFSKLRMAFERRQCRIPINRAIREDLHSMQRVTSNNGTVTYRAPHTDDGHADRCTAKALAQRAAGSNCAPVAYAGINTGQSSRSFGFIKSSGSASEIRRFFIGTGGTWGCEPSNIADRRYFAKIDPKHHGFDG